MRGRYWVARRLFLAAQTGTWFPNHSFLWWFSWCMLIYVDAVLWHLVTNQWYSWFMFWFSLLCGSWFETKPFNRRFLKPNKPTLGVLLVWFLIFNGSQSNLLMISFWNQHHFWTSMSFATTYCSLKLNLEVVMQFIVSFTSLFIGLGQFCQSQALTGGACGALWCWDSDCAVVHFPCQAQ